jgi:hypothetical protein
MESGRGKSDAPRREAWSECFWPFVSKRSFLATNLSSEQQPKKLDGLRDQS